MNRTKLHNMWGNMKQRCHYKANPWYPYYGGRGITVCPEWRNDAATFIRWALSNGYDETLQIDRIDNNGNYSPDNCRFVTRPQNMVNRGKQSNGLTSKYKGVYWDKSRNKWHVRVGHKHIGRFNTEIGAARAYDIAVREKYGKFAVLNFPDR